jgi:hypothetical protein
MKDEKCSICGRKLNFWFTPLKKYKGETICSSCAWKIAKQEINNKTAEQKTDETTTKIDDFGKKLNKLGIKLIVGLTIPIILFFIGLFTLPIGILFWVLGIVLFAKLFTKKEGEKK